MEDDSKVDTLDSQYKSANFGMENGGEPAGGG